MNILTVLRLPSIAVTLRVGICVPEFLRLLDDLFGLLTQPLGLANQEFTQRLQFLGLIEEVSDFRVGHETKVGRTRAKCHTQIPLEDSNSRKSWNVRLAPVHWKPS